MQVPKRERESEQISHVTEFISRALDPVATAPGSDTTLAVLTRRSRF